MEVVSRVIRIQLPNYLRSLPIPSTFGGFLKLSGSEWVQLVPFVVTTSVVAYLVVSALVPSKPKREEEWVNKTHQKEKEKVADAFEIEDLGEKTVYCRCWKSKKVCAETFPILSFLLQLRKLASLNGCLQNEDRRPKNEDPNFFLPDKARTSKKPSQSVPQRKQMQK